VTLRTPSGRKSAGISLTLKNVDIIWIFDPHIDRSAMGNPTQPEPPVSETEAPEEKAPSDDDSKTDEEEDPSPVANKPNVETEPGPSQKGAPAAKTGKPSKARGGVPEFGVQIPPKKLGKKSGKAPAGKSTSSKPERTKPNFDWYIMDNKDKFVVKVGIIMSK